MILVYGETTRDKIRPGGNVYCFACKHDLPYQIRETRSYFHLYWILLIPQGIVAERIICSGCNREFEKIALDGPVEEQAAEMIIDATTVLKMALGWRFVNAAGVGVITVWRSRSVGTVAGLWVNRYRGSRATTFQIW